MHKWGEGMFSGSFLAHDVVHMPTRNGQRIGDQRTMAAPGEGFRTHDRGCVPPGQCLQFGQARLKGRRCHIIGKAAKRGIAPAGIRGSLRRMAQAAQRFEVTIVNTGSLEGTGEEIATKLGMCP